METNNELVSVQINSFETCSKFKEMPLVALRQKSRLILSKLLNFQKILASEENLPRDWRGIAHLAGLGTHRLEISNHGDPMAKVLQLWKSEGDKQTATFFYLQTFLGRIDRWDVVDDINEYLVEDAEYYNNSQQQTGTEKNLDPCQKVLQGRDDNILTHDDVERAHHGLSPQLYDAFVLFADEDIDFATELIERMENFGFKLCVKERDLIGGVSFEHEAILRLISERCNRLIVIVSPSFLKSPANAFFVNFAQALGIEQKRRKIVPCLYQTCILPPTLNFYFLLNYQRSGRLCNFWDKLKDSIKSTPTESNRQIQVPRITITEIESSECSEKLHPLEMTTESELPIKAPRRRRDKIDSFRSQNSILNATNSMKVSPVPDRKPCTVSMTVHSSNNSNPTICDMSSSSLAMKNNPVDSSRNVKKIRWYSQLFKSNPINIVESKSSEKTSKRKLFRKKVAANC